MKVALQDAHCSSSHLRGNKAAPTRWHKADITTVLNHVTLPKIAEGRDNPSQSGLNAEKSAPDDCLPDTREVCDDSRNQ